MNRITDINREIKQLMKRLVDGDQSVLHSIIKLSRERENLLKPRKFNDE